MNLFFLSVISYLAGIVTFLAPCTLPILPFYLSVCMKNGFRSLTRHTFYLGIGMATVYIMLGVFAGSIGGFIIESKIILVNVLSILLVFAGITMIFGMSTCHVMPRQKNFSSVATIGYGVVFGLVWSGCIGPVLGGILVIAGATGTAAQGALLLFIYSLGMITPLFILSFIADKNKKIPKLWTFLYGRTFSLRIGSKTFVIHTTNLFTGVLFISLGLFFMFDGTIWLASSFPGLMNATFTVEEILQRLIIK